MKPHCTIPHQCSAVLWGATSTRHYCRCVHKRQLCRILDCCSMQNWAMLTWWSDNLHEYVHSICLRSFSLSTLAHRDDLVQYGFIRAQVYSQHKKVLHCQNAGRPIGVVQSIRAIVSRCIERPGALILGINKTRPAMMTSPDVYDYYDVRKWRNRSTLGLNVAENTNYMKKSFK